MKATTLAKEDIEQLKKDLEDARKSAIDWRARNDARELELREARKKNDELSMKIFGAQGEIAALRSAVGRLEGYRERVERVDALDRGLKPKPRSEEGLPDGVELRGSRHDGFWER